MKVLMLTPSYDPIIGGTETVVKYLAINLNKTGVNTDVMTFNMDIKWKPKWKWEIKNEEEFKVYRIPAFNPFERMPNLMGYLFRFHAIPAPSFSKIVKEYDILHFHDEVDLTFPLTSHFIDRPKIFHCHTLWETFNFYRKNVFCRKIFLGSSDVYLAVSKSVEKLARELGAKNVKVLPNGVDTDKFAFSQDREDNLILFVGRFERSKGIHILIDALNFLETSTNLIIIGPNSNDEYSKEILWRIERENRKGKHNVAYLGSFCLNDLVKYYQKSSVFVCPSLSEAFGIVNLEAMSCGTPVIASNVGGIRDIVENGKNGILVPPNDPIKLAEAIEYLLNNKDIRIKLGKEGRKKVEREFSWNVIVKRLYRIYEEMI